VDQDGIQATISKVDNLTDVVTDYSSDLALSLEKDMLLTRDISEKIVVITQLESDTLLIRSVTVLYFDAEMHVLRGYFHASPGLLAVLAGIWNAIKYIWDIIKGIVDIWMTLKELGILDLLADIWPAFEKLQIKFRQIIGRISDALGWGATGLLHLIHATQGTISVFGGLSGKGDDWLEIEWMEEAERIAEYTVKYSEQMSDNPSYIADIFFHNEQKEYIGGIRGWTAEKLGLLEEVGIKTKEIAEDIGSVTSELAAIQDGMPETVAKHIPQRIWDSLDKADYFINDRILPEITGLVNKLNTFNKLLDAYSAKMSGLAAKLALPGDLLSDVDNLSDALRTDQEDKIDDIASRSSARAADEMLDVMTSDLDEFAKIDEAITAPIPPLSFMEIESPARRKLTGITAEPRETWFVGDY